MTAVETADGFDALFDELNDQVTEVREKLHDRIKLLSNDPLPTLQDTLDNARDDDLVDAAILDLVAGLKKRSRQRAAIEFRRRLAGLSPWPETRDQAKDYQDVGQVALETDEFGQWVDFAVKVGTKALRLGVSLHKKNKMGAIAHGLGLGNIIFDAVRQGSIPGFGEPPRTQLDDIELALGDLRLGMKERFDVIDQKLDALYATTVQGFGDLLGGQLGIRDDISELSAELHRLEARLIGVLAELAFLDLKEVINAAIGYRENNGIEMPFNGGGDFIEFKDVFRTWCVDEPTDTFAQDDGTTINEASKNLANSLDNEINVLSRLASEIDPDVGRLGDPGLVNALVWSQSADAFAQLLSQNPWYAAFLAVQRKVPRPRGT